MVDRLSLDKETLRAALNSLTEAVFIIGPPHRQVIEACNLATEDVFGYKPEELEGETTEILHVDKEKFLKFGELSEAILDENGTFETEYKMQRKDGTVIDTLNTVTVLHKEEGWQGGVVSVVRDITERKEVERALRETQQRYATISRNLPRGVVQVLDRDLKYVFSQGEELEKVGFSPRAMLGKHLSDLLPPDNVDRVSEYYQQVLEGEPVIFEGSFAGRQFLTNAAPLRNDRGEVEHILSLSINITERKNMERKLQERLKEMTCLYAVNRDMRVLHDEQALYRRVVEHLVPAMRFPEITVPVLSITGKRYTTNGYHPDLDHYLESPVEMDGEVVGHLRVYYTDPRPFLDPEEQDLLDSIAKSLGLWGENMRREQSLKRNERRFRALIKNAPDGIALLGEDGKLQHLSPATQRIMGYDPEADLVQEPAALTHPEDVEDLQRALQELQGSPGKMITEVYRLRHKDGGYRWLESKISNLLHVPGVRALVFNYRDITERVEAEQALEQREQRFRGLIENVADVITVVDESGKITYQSPAAEKVFGYAPQEQIGNSAFQYFHPDDVSKVEKLLIEISAEPNAMSRSQARMQHKEGGYRVIESVGKNRLKDPALEGIVITSRDITDRVRYEERIKRQAEQLGVLFETALTISSILDRDQVVREIHGKVESLIPYDRFTVYSYDAVKKKVKKIFATNEDGVEVDQDGGASPINDSGLSGWVIGNQKPLVIRDMDVNTLPTAPAMGDAGAKSWLGVPLLAGGEIMGAIALQSSQRDKFDREDRRLLESLAAQVAIALKNARLFEEAERRLRVLQGLRSIDSAISNSLDRDVSLQVVLDQSISQLEVDAAAVLLFDPHLQTLEFAVGKGFKTSLINETTLRLGEGYSGRAAITRDIVRLPELPRGEMSFSREELVAAESFRSFFAVPLVAKGKIKGILEVYQRNPYQPSEEWMDLMTTLAGQAAIAIDNAELFEKLQKANTELSLAYDNTLEGWAKTLELRDIETEGHSRRVTKMTIELARRLGVREDDLVHVYRGALLHDIGKMGIPDRILHKTGPLIDEEWALMKQHPTMAYNLLSQIAYLQPACEIPYSHHERWDGSGYPRGLEGEQIPLSARIFAVVDVWDALRSDRPYREAWSDEKTLSYIKDKTGKEFDPRVVKEFLDLIQN